MSYESKRWEDHTQFSELIVSHMREWGATPKVQQPFGITSRLRDYSVCRVDFCGWSFEGHHLSIMGLRQTYVDIPWIFHGHSLVLD